jgi:methylmalonyl-CoA mutase
VTTANDRFCGELTVADLFPAATIEDWRTLAEQSLRGTSLDTLVVTTHEGVDVRPLYTADDLSRLTAAPIGPSRRPWQACQQVRHPLPEVAGAEIAEDAGRGVEAAWLLFDRSVRCAVPLDQPEVGTELPDGLVIATATELGRLLDAANLDDACLFLDPGGNALGTAAALVAAAQARGRDPAELDGGLGCDPLAALAADGVLPYGLNRSLALLPDLVTWCDRSAPRLRALSVSSLPYTMSGAHAVQEVGYMLATAVEYLRAVTRTGVPVDVACHHLRFVTTSGRDLLMEIAKLRALRGLWQRVAEACGGAGESRVAWIHTVTSPRTLTVRDPWVNLVRTTVEAFGAVIGGSDTVTVLPFDHAIGPPDALARRVAALGHALLREESHLHRVVDPAAGSYAIERLTEDLEDRAWGFFQEIEAAGGMVERITGGIVRDELAEILEARRRATAEGRDPITGVTSHPDPAEERLDRAPVDTSGHAKRTRAALANRRPPSNELERLRSAAAIAAGDGAVMDAAVDACAAGATLWEIAAAIAGEERATQIEPLPSERDAETFENNAPAGGSG